MNKSVKVEVIKERSFDPHYLARVSYDDGTNKFINETVSVTREPPKIEIEYSESIKKIMDQIDVKKIELEIMKAILESLLGSKS